MFLSKKIVQKSLMKCANMGCQIYFHVYKWKNDRLSSFFLIALFIERNLIKRLFFFF